ncbi:type I DNA topoisomerase [Algicella marina]|uniref:DNA topoisomerase 1 n=1 Tax=Algicella marina TaxID=2683284 RepID=A0A6P1T1K6_9RHOB|nr:type I DNA topoisomerase [Algicella marina]QHQ35867.1 type I DNA topoisomerase [Algicella marina]
MAVVVVESPAKAKTINKYLGKDYTVLASYGHVRDLPPKDGSVDTDHEFEMKWEVASASQKHVRAIAEALKDDDTLILATDPDREGEAISWHLQEALTKRRAIKKDTKVERVVFNAITKSAVTEAMKNPRAVDMELVEAYLARRALDYLVGFNLSPVLWRKLPGAKSAGRVQSVALRLIVEREMEIEAFNAREFWSVRAMLETPRGQQYEARLTHLAGKKLDKFDIATAEAAELAVTAVASRDLKVASVEAKPASRNPSAPFMTSTLQQEASRKFGFGARQTMSTAQRLYEAGYITYMRTDGIDMAPEAVTAAREAIKSRYGAEYIPGSPRIYKNKAKNAQEAHECIRPTDMALSAEDLGSLEADQKKLYDLIWKRTLASQMEAAKLERTTVDVSSDDGQITLRATGQVIQFDGFLRVYEEGRDDVGDDEDGKRLPQISEGEAAAKARRGLAEAFAKLTPDAVVESPGTLQKEANAILGGEGAVLGQQSFTQPPPRYTEATLVKRMEELGIGRPSTYASIVSVIQERDYVRKEQNRLIPEDKGRLVTAFLENYFRKYVGYDFTADLENDLDRITSGDAQWKTVLTRFWTDFRAALDETADLRITEVLEKINEVLAPHIFPAEEDGSDPRICKNCGAGRLSLKTARSGGAFIGCSNYPECRYTRPLSGELEGGDIAGPDGKVLGLNDEGETITLRTGRFGPYVQQGDVTEEVPKPKRASVPKGEDLSTVDLPRALQLLSLPRKVGDHPEGGIVEAAIGRFGPFVVWVRPPAEGEKKESKTYANIKDPAEVYTIGMNRAMELIAQKAASGRGRGAAATPLKELGEHPDGGPVNVMPGRYGPYVKWEKVNATIPKETKPEDVTMEQALELIAAKAPKKKAPAKKKTAPKKSTAKKPASKKTASTKGS